MDKRFQVFVSSTFQDLEDERREVIQALLELRCIPAGMELFPAADDSQWELIKKVIDDCDYYLVIIGGRYGTIGPTGESFTEMEYRYALTQGKPIIAFLHKDPDKIEAGKSETDPAKKAKLSGFRDLAQKKMVRYWTSAADLGSVVSRSVVLLMNTSPAVGWVKADRLLSEASAAEILKLRNRIDELQRELAAARTTAPEETHGLAQGDDEIELAYTMRVLASNGYTSRPASATYRARWSEVFFVLSPLMIDEASEATLRRALNEHILHELQTRFAEHLKKTGETLKDLDIRDPDFQTVKVQLRALSLIAKSTKARSVKDTGTYWSLTPYGDTTMVRLRAIRRSSAATSSTPETSPLIDGGGQPAAKPAI